MGMNHSHQIAYTVHELSQKINILLIPVLLLEFGVEAVRL